MPRVVVVGAGIAGLAAAHRLARSGLEVRVLERAPQPGGRAASEAEKESRFEPGAHVASLGDRRWLDLVAAAGLAETHLPLRPVRLAQAKPGRVVPIDPTGRPGLARIPGVGHLASLRAGRLERLLARFGPGLDREAPELGADQDDRSVADFVRLYFGRRALSGWIAPWMAEHAAADVEETSRVLAMRLLERERFLPAGTLRGDLAEVSRALARDLSLELGCEARRLERRADRLVVHHAHGDCEADAVVVALPAAATLSLGRPLLTSAEVDFLGAARTSDLTSVALGLEAALARQAARVRVPAALGVPFHAVTLERGVEGGRVPEGRGLAILLGPGTDSEPEALVARWIVGLDRLFPGASRRVAWSRVTRHPGAHPLFPVGRYRALARFRCVEADARARGRRLYFAGDHLVAPTLEGAALSGHRAATSLLTDLGR